jgi:hypothetical protein
VVTNHASPTANGVHPSDADEVQREERPAFDPEFLTDASFAAADFRPVWLVRRLLVRGQPAVIGGPKKSLKTSLLVDLALSLGTGGRFLGTFPVERRVQVAVVSGESGGWTLQETRRRVAAAKGMDGPADVVWGLKLPQLADATQVEALAEQVEHYGVEVLLLDPLYLCLLAGVAANELSATNLYQVGPLFAAVARALLSVGCTPIMVHHYKLSRADHYAEPQLEDLAFAGIQEFARQWLLLGRREKYQPGTGIHRLWLSAGGSVGHGGLWTVDVDEGVLLDDFTGRKWEVEVAPAGDVRQHEREAKPGARERAKAEQRQADEAALLVALDKLDPEARGAGVDRVRALAGLTRDRMASATERLTAQGFIRRMSVTVEIGSRATREVAGIARVRRETTI